MDNNLSNVQKNWLLAQLENTISKLFSLSEERLDRLVKHIWPSFRQDRLVFTCESWVYEYDELDLLPCSSWLSSALNSYLTRFLEQVIEHDYDHTTGRAAVEAIEGHDLEDSDYDEEGNEVTPLIPVKCIPTVNYAIPVTFNMKRGIRNFEKTVLAKPKRMRVVRSRARAYSRDLKSGYVGTMLHRATGDPLRDASQRLHALTAGDFLTKNRQVIIYAIFGRGGSKKSSDIKDWVRAYLDRDSLYRNRSAVTVICPTNHLRAEWMKDSNTKWTYMIKTLETALFETPNGVVIIDDVSKFPAGYVDALIVLHPQIKYLIVTGDVTQLDYRSPNANSETNRLESEGLKLAKFADYYFNFTYRSPQSHARRYGIRSYNLEEGVFDNNPPPYIENGAIIVPGMQQEADLIGAGRDAYTYSNSQGLDYHEVHGVIDRNTAAMDYKALNTVYTRSKNILRIHNYATDLPLPLFAAMFEAANPTAMIEFMTNKIKTAMPKAIILNEDPRINKKKLIELYNFNFAENKQVSWADEVTLVQHNMAP